MEGTLTRSLTNLPLARIEWRATFSQANSHTHTHTHTHLLSLSLLSLSLTQGEEGTLIHSLTCRSHTQSRGHTHSHLPLSHRVEGTLILTSKLKRRVESTLTPTLSLSLTHTMEELSLSLSHSLSPMNTLTLLHTYRRGRTH